LTPGEPVSANWRRHIVEGLDFCFGRQNPRKIVFKGNSHCAVWSSDLLSMSGDSLSNGCDIFLGHIVGENVYVLQYFFMLNFMNNLNIDYLYSLRPRLKI
jgi:hypothetical protein